MIKITVEKKEENKELPFVTIDIDGIVRLYFKNLDDDKVISVDMNDGLVSAIYTSEKEAIESFIYSNEKIIEAELIIKE